MTLFSESIAKVSQHEYEVEIRLLHQKQIPHLTIRQGSDDHLKAEVNE